MQKITLRVSAPTRYGIALAGGHYMDVDGRMVLLTLLVAGVYWFGVWIGRGNRG